jgi:hypothetical protein
LGLELGGIFHQRSLCPRADFNADFRS